MAPDGAKMGPKRCTYRPATLASRLQEPSQSHPRQSWPFNENECACMRSSLQHVLHRTGIGMHVSQHRQIMIQVSVAKKALKFVLQEKTKQVNANVIHTTVQSDHTRW